MAAETQYTANTGIALISTANANLNGTGTLVTVLTAASNGTLMKTITIKALGNTTAGMVRFFFYDGANTKLALEVPIPAITRSATDPTFQVTIPVYFTLKSGWQLKASTHNAETFHIIAEAQDWAYYASSVRSDTTKYTAYNGGINLTTANSNLDGSGALGTVLTSSGCNIQSITIKAQQDTIAGMIRLFLYDGAAYKLFNEIPVPALSKSDEDGAFFHKIIFEDGFALKSGWSLKASTEKGLPTLGQQFSVMAESLDWSYPA